MDKPPLDELYCRNEQYRTFNGVRTSMASVVLHVGCVIVYVCSQGRVVGSVVGVLKVSASK